MYLTKGDTHDIFVPYSTYGFCRRIMSDETGSPVILPPVQQVGIVVKDIDQAVDFYSRVLGWGPFTISEYPMKGVIFKGKPTDCRIKVADATRAVLTEVRR